MPSNYDDATLIGIVKEVTDIMLANDNCPYMVIWGIKARAGYAQRTDVRPAGTESRTSFG